MWLSVVMVTIRLNSQSFKQEYTTVRVSSGKETQMFFSHPKNRNMYCNILLPPKNILEYKHFKDMLSQIMIVQQPDNCAVRKVMLCIKQEHTLELFSFLDQRVKKRIGKINSSQYGKESIFSFRLYQSTCFRVLFVQVRVWSVMHALQCAIRSYFARKKRQIQF